MAIQQHDRENLLEEARAYRRRILVKPRVSTDACGEALGLQREGTLSEFFAGQRVNGGWSLYFDQETVLQFAPTSSQPSSEYARPGCLRRLFWQNRKFAVERKQLVELVRGQVGGRVQLLRQLLPSSQTLAILADCHHQIEEISDWFQAESGYEVVGKVPTGDTSLLTEVQHLLAQLKVAIRLTE